MRLFAFLACPSGNVVARFQLLGGYQQTQRTIRQTYTTVDRAATITSRAHAATRLRTGYRSVRGVASVKNAQVGQAARDLDAVRVSVRPENQATDLMGGETASVKARDRLRSIGGDDTASECTLPA